MHYFAVSRLQGRWAGPREIAKVATMDYGEEAETGEEGLLQAVAAVGRRVLEMEEESSATERESEELSEQRGAEGTDKTKKMFAVLVKMCTDPFAADKV